MALKIGHVPLNGHAHTPIEAQGKRAAQARSRGGADWPYKLKVLNTIPEGASMFSLPCSIAVLAFWRAAGEPLSTDDDLKSSVSIGKT